MFKRLELVAWLASGIVGRVSKLAFRHGEVRQIADKFYEFFRRVRRAGLLFIVMVGGLFAFSLLIHPVGLLLWLLALPLAGFSSLLSMLWPTRRPLTVGAGPLPLNETVTSTLRRLRHTRADVPLRALPAFDRVVHKLKRIEGLAGDDYDAPVLDEARRLSGRHLPRLVNSFVALPPAERTCDRAEALAEALTAIAEELDDLGGRLSSSRADRFEIERRFIANRFPPNRLVGIWGPG